MKNTRRLRIAVTIGLVAAFGSVVAQSTFTPDNRNSPPDHHPPPSPPPPPQPPPPPPPAPSNFGDPLPNLTADQLAAFLEGKDAFMEADTVETGLGPVFNGVSCVACHSAPATGGGSTTLETRFGKMVSGVFDPMIAQGGSLLQQFAIDSTAQEFVPADANVTASRMTTPLFGLGLVEAIPDSIIILNALLPKPDGVTGRVSMVNDVASGKMRVGRFGWKAQQATLLSFSGDAYLNEIGVTSRLFPVENAPNGNLALLAQYDTTIDPEDVADAATGKADIDEFADYMRLLAPPPKLALMKSAVTGALVFLSVGCAACHTPVMLTGKSSVAALDHKAVPLYSDLLLHDMGTLGDGIAQSAAGPTEMKTAPLWGARVRTLFLHDGRAATIDAAIRLHDGEAARARDRYNALDSGPQQQLLDFLNSI